MPQMEDIVTPIKVNKLRDLLVEAGYPESKMKELVTGFKQGFDIGYRGPKVRKHTSQNLPFRVGSKTELWNKVMKEVKMNRYAGPFKVPPTPQYVQSPLGLVPKDKDKTRLIFHLSYDFGEDEINQSVNYHMPKELCTVRYRDMEHAIKNCVRLLQLMGLDTEILYFSKTDCSNAFRVIPVLVLQRFLLTMMAIHPVTNQCWYFVDKCLPFGLSRSCAIFQSFSDALEFLAAYRMMRKEIVEIYPAITNYLDDFLFIALTITICYAMMAEFLDLCSEVGCPISEEKTVQADSIMVFLGMLLNRKERVIAIPLDKIIKAANLIQLAISKHKVTIKFIQQLTGTLNFLNKAIVPGRAFTRGMYRHLRITDKKGRLLKDHHHTYLCSQFIQDCKVWLGFLFSFGMPNSLWTRIPALNFWSCMLWWYRSQPCSTNHSCKTKGSKYSVITKR